MTKIFISLSYLNKNNIEYFEIKDDKIIIEVRGNNIESEFDLHNFDKTIANLRESLDQYVDDIGLKEGLILEISRNWAAIGEECSLKPINSYSEWRKGLESRYLDLKQTIKKYFP